MILQQDVSQLIQPDGFSTALVILLSFILLTFGYIAIELRHTALLFTWVIALLIIGNIIVVGLPFVWFWIIVMVMAIVTGIAGVYRFFVIPVFKQT